MQDTLKIWMSIEDADMVEKLFTADPNPNYTVVKRQKIDGADCVMMEFVADSTIHIWYLAKKVQMFQDSDARIKRMFEETNRIIKEKSNKLK